MRTTAAFLGLSSLCLASLTLACGDTPPTSDDEVGDTATSQTGSTEAGSSGSESGVEASGSGSESASEAESTSESTSDASESNDASDSSGSASDTTDTSETTDTGGPEPVAFCVDACVVAADCASSDPSFNADNWECLDGGCHWLGCKDNECNPGFVCHDPGTGTPSCVRECVVPDECAQGFGPFIASNYVCDVGACVFLGCMADAECEDFGPGYRCSAATEPPSCTPPCQDVQDCTSPMPAYDLDNWSCEAGACVWLGCKDGECGKTKVCQLD